MPLTALLGMLAINRFLFHILDSLAPAISFAMLVGFVYFSFSYFKNFGKDLPKDRDNK